MINRSDQTLKHKSNSRDEINVFSIFFTNKFFYYYYLQERSNLKHPNKENHDRLLYTMEIIEIKFLKVSQLLTPYSTVFNEEIPLFDILFYN